MPYYLTNCNLGRPSPHTDRRAWPETALFLGVLVIERLMSPAIQMPLDLDMPHNYYSSIFA